MTLPHGFTLQQPFLAGDPPSPGADYLLDPYLTLPLPFDAQCTALTTDERRGQYVSVYSAALPHDINSAGLIVRGGNRVYLRLHTDTPPNAQVGEYYPAGHPTTYPQDTTQRLTIALRVGGASGIPGWEAGVVRSILDHPDRPGYGYPAGGEYLRRAVALRFLDPAVLGLSSVAHPRRLL